MRMPNGYRANNNEVFLNMAKRNFTPKDILQKEFKPKMRGYDPADGYYDQGQSNLTRTNTVLDELWNDFSTTPEVEIRNRLGAFLFSGDDVKKSVAMLSGGERARLLLAKLSMENNNFLILDEPTKPLR